MKNFGDQFKKELDEIRVNRDLLNRTTEKIRAESERSSPDATPVPVPSSSPAARKETRRNRIFFLKTAAALAAVALVATGAFFLISYLGRSGKAESYMDGSVNEKQALSSPDPSMPVTVAMAATCDGIENAAEDSTASRDPDLVRLDDYETLLTQMRKNNYIKAVDANNAPAGTEDASRAFSGTNIQTAGVDESDIVKSDENTLYYVNSNRLKIFDIHDPADIRLNSDIILSRGEGGRIGIGLHFDPVSGKLWLISQSGSDRGNLYEEPETDCETQKTGFYFSTETVTVETYDVRDPSDPVLLSAFSQDGTYRSSRRIGQTVYLITEKSTFGHPYDTPEVFPAVKRDDGPWATIPARDTFVIGSGYIGSFTVVSAIGDPEEGGKTISLAVASAGGTVYASPDMLFVAGTTSDFIEHDDCYEATTTFSTRIISFSIADGGLTAFGAGSVPGMIINPYSLDQRDDYLRIATTSYDPETLQRVNNVFVLDDRLDIFSSLEGLAPGEPLYSVRFEDELIYLATFDGFDPLFVVDASDPEDLKVIGALKIPGFCKYLHPVGNHLLLGIGQIRPEDGSNAPAGLRLSLFDVSDPKSPVLRSTLVYGINWGTSEAEYDPKALMTGPRDDMFGLPVWFDKEPPAEPSGDDVDVEGYLLVRIDSDQELIEEHLFVNIGHKGFCRGLFTPQALFIVCDTSIDSFDIDTYEPLDSHAIEYD